MSLSPRREKDQRAWFCRCAKICNCTWLRGRFESRKWMRLWIKRLWAKHCCRKIRTNKNMSWWRGVPRNSLPFIWARAASVCFHASARVYKCVWSMIKSKTKQQRLANKEKKKAQHKPILVQRAKRSSFISKLLWYFGYLRTQQMVSIHFRFTTGWRDKQGSEHLYHLHYYTQCLLRGVLVLLPQWQSRNCNFNSAPPTVVFVHFNVTVWYELLFPSIAESMLSISLPSCCGLGCASTSYHNPIEGLPGPVSLSTPRSERLLPVWFALPAPARSFLTCSYVNFDPT